MSQLNLKAKKLGKNIQAYMEMAKAHMAAKEYDAALSALGKVLEENPELPAAYFAIGRIQFMKGNYEEALKYFEATLHLDDSNAMAHSMIAKIYAMNDEPHKAIEKFKIALEVDPKSMQSSVGLARCYLEMEKYQEAEKCITDAIKFNPEATQASLMLCSIYKKQKNTDAAEKILKDLIVRDSESKIVHMHFGQFCVEQNRFKDAILAFEKAISLDESDANAYFYLGLAHLKTKEADKAIEPIKKAYELNPKMEDTYNIALAQAYIELNRYNEAKTLLQKLAQGEKRLGVVHFMLAEIYTKQGHPLQAVQEFGAALAHSPELAEKHPELAAMLASDADDKSKAEFLLEKFAESVGAMDKFGPGESPQ